jgi:hypothetical protein
MSFRHSILATLLGLASWGVALAGPIELASATTRVGPVKVALQVDDLTLDSGALVGRYRLKIPMFPPMNDRGVLRLPLSVSIERLVATGGRILGSGYSVEDGRTHAITCDVEPGGAVTITVDTGDRILSFQSQIRPAP